MQKKEGFWTITVCTQFICILMKVLNIRVTWSQRLNLRLMVLLLKSCLTSVLLLFIQHKNSSPCCSVAAGKRRAVCCILKNVEGLFIVTQFDCYELCLV